MDLIDQNKSLSSPLVFEFNQTIKTEGGDPTDPDTNGKPRTLRSTLIYFRDGKTGDIGIKLGDESKYYCAIKKGKGVWSNSIIEGTTIKFETGSSIIKSSIALNGKASDGESVKLTCEKAGRNGYSERIAGMTVTDLYQVIFGKDSFNPGIFNSTNSNFTGLIDVSHINAVAEKVIGGPETKSIIEFLEETSVVKNATYYELSVSMIKQKKAT